MHIKASNFVLLDIHSYSDYELCRISNSLCTMHLWNDVYICLQLLLLLLPLLRFWRIMDWLLKRVRSYELPLLILVCVGGLILILKTYRDHDFYCWHEGGCWRKANSKGKGRLWFVNGVEFILNTIRSRLKPGP